MTLNDLEWLFEWPFYVKFSNVHYCELTLRVLLADFESIIYLFTVESVESVYIDQRRCGKRSSGP